jgi:hypothetical protein
MEFYLLIRLRRFLTNYKSKPIRKNDIIVKLLRLRVIMIL